jgi:hypothetical protein
MTQAEPTIMYAYHHHDVEHNLIFQYDDAAQRPALSPREHRHTHSGIEASPAPTLAEGMAVKMSESPAYIDGQEHPSQGKGQLMLKPHQATRWRLPVPCNAAKDSGLAEISLW